VRSSDLDDAVYPTRPPVYRDFHDKLAPAARWLQSQIGRPWSKVEGELFARFDARTTAGRHILFCHMLEAAPVDRYGLPRVSFKVDRHGILRGAIPKKYEREALPFLPNQVDVEAWLGSRRVGQRGSRFFWFLPTESGHFRQAGALTEIEVERWSSLPDWFRERRNAFAPPAETDRCPQ
jgi:hypothetical protein